MKKNGFIATSLIYSFFLIFITLFLTIIVDYLQQRVLLNEAEAGVKAELNKVIGIKDFVAGDFISFDSTCSGNDIPASRQYVVANIVIDDASKCDGTHSDCLILYSLQLANSFTVAYPSSILTYNDIKNDLEDGIKNATFINDILYTYDGTNSYKINEGSTKYNISKTKTSCVTATEKKTYETDKGCIKSGEGTNNRNRVVYYFTTNNKTKCEGHRGSYVIKDSL